MNQQGDRITQIITALRALLQKHSGNGLPLTIADDAYIVEDGWIYLTVTPGKPGV